MNIINEIKRSINKRRIELKVEKGKTYYIRRKHKLMKQFDNYLNTVKTFMSSHFPDLNSEDLTVKMRNEYESLIPQLPYVGGSKNTMLPLLIGSVSLLAVMRILEKKGIAIRDIGKFCYDFYETVAKTRRSFEESGKTDLTTFMLSENIMFQKEYLDVLKLVAKESQLRRYPGDWVYEFVEGDGKTFDHGINFTECAIYKFFKEQSDERFIPFICLFDFAAARASGYGFKRTQTIWNGAPFCDFRYIKEGNTQRGWPPENLQEFKEI